MAYPDHILEALTLAGRDFVSIAVKHAPFRLKKQAELDAIREWCMKVYGGLPGGLVDLPGGRMSEAEAMTPMRIENILKWADQVVPPIK